MSNIHRTTKENSEEVVYRNVNSTTVPCKNCKTTSNYCWYVEGGETYGCRAHDGPGGVRKLDAQGVEHWVFGAGKGLPAALGEATKKHKSLTGTPQERHKAYAALLKGLDLADADSPFPEAKSLGYRSSPLDDVSRFQAAKAVWDVAEEDPREFLRIPGTIMKAMDDNRQEPTLRNFIGTYIPVRNSKGEIAAIQVRLKDPRPGTGKYLPLTGMGDGSAAERIAHVPTVARKLREGETVDPREIIRVTEGVKKADVATLKTPILTLGLPSANAWKLAWEPIQELGGKTVRIAYDADACQTRAVCTSLLSCMQHYLSVSRVVELETWDKSHKGIDDALLDEVEIQVLSGLDMYERVRSWCDASGATIPEWLVDRITILKAHRDLENNPSVLGAPEVLEALIRLEHSPDHGPVKESLEALFAEGNKDGVRYRFERALGSKRSELKKAVKAAEAKERKERAEAQGLPTFAIGSDTEIATLLTKEFDAISDEGALWSYDSELGIWAEVFPEALERRIMQYDGAPCGKSSLAVNDSKVRGSLKRFEALRRQRDFFSGAPVGFTFSNGFVRVDENGIHLMEHQPGQKSRGRYAYPYDPDATCVEFERFLFSIFSTVDWARMDPRATEEIAMAKAEVRQRMQYVLEFFGLCLLGLAKSHVGTALILLGDGANGKSTLLELIESLFPPELVSGVAPHDWTNEQSVALLRGKRINIVGELPNKDLQESAAWKAVVTGDAWLKGKNVYERPFTFKALAGQVIAANVMGAAGDGSFGWARRNAIITMTRVFLDHEQDKGLLGKLKAESQGIVSLLLRNAWNAIQRGKSATSHKAAMQRWLSG